jgi:hypothetical protein
MRIASVTMVGQFPDGIDIHVRNLRWVLSEEDHTYIVTNSSFVKNYDLRNTDRTTYIGFFDCNDVRTSSLLERVSKDTALSAIFLHRREQFFAGFRTFCES